jgi:hypothetical protein
VLGGARRVKAADRKEIPVTDTKSHPASQSATSRGDWRLLAVVLVGSFMAVLDTTIEGLCR